MIHDAPPLPPLKKRRNFALPLLALVLVAWAGYWWGTNRPAHITAITIWLPDGRPVVVPPDSPDFAALKRVVQSIAPLTPQTVRQTFRLHRVSSIFPAWFMNPDGVCIEAHFDRVVEVGLAFDADRVVIGSQGTRLPNAPLLVAMNSWTLGVWLESPIDARIPQSRFGTLGEATDTALKNWQPADAPTIPAPANTEAVLASPTQSTLDPVPDEVWDGIAFHLAAPLTQADAWDAGAKIALSAGAVTLECRFKQPILLTDDAGGQWRMRAIHFAWLKDARHGVAWVETDHGIYRWRAAHIYKPLELYLYRAGTYGPGATAPHGGDL